MDKPHKPKNNLSKREGKRWKPARLGPPADFRVRWMVKETSPVMGTSFNDVTDVVEWVAMPWKKFLDLEPSERRWSEDEKPSRCQVIGVDAFVTERKWRPRVMHLKARQPALPGPVAPA